MHKIPKGTVLMKGGTITFWAFHCRRCEHFDVMAEEPEKCPKCDLPKAS